MNNLTEVTYTVSYLKGHSLEPYNQRNKNYLIPFHYDSTDQLVVTINGEITNDYHVYGSQLFLDDKPADKSEVTITRRTNLKAETTAAGEMAEFTPGHPVKAEDLNDNYSWLVQRIEELEAKINE